MKIIILEVTLSLLCKTQEDFNNLVTEGYKLKEVNNIKYLIKDDII